MEENQEITQLKKEIVSLKREVAFLRHELNMEIKHPIASIIITCLLIGIGLLTVYLKDHPELLNF